MIPYNYIFFQCANCVFFLMNLLGAVALVNLLRRYYQASRNINSLCNNCSINWYNIIQEEKIIIGRDYFLWMSYKLNLGGSCSIAHPRVWLPSSSNYYYYYLIYNLYFFQYYFIVLVTFYSCNIDSDVAAI